MNGNSLSAGAPSRGRKIFVMLAAVGLLAIGAGDRLGVLAASVGGPNAPAEAGHASTPKNTPLVPKPGDDAVVLQAATASSASGSGSGPSAPTAACAAIITVLPNDAHYVQTANAPLTITRYERGVYLITAAELAANGLSSGSAITGIGWSYDLPPGAAGIPTPLKVYLENTSDTTMRSTTDWATEIGSMTLVHSNNLSIANFFGTLDIGFSGSGTSPFTYTGGGLYVAFDFGRNNGGLAVPSATMVGVLVNTALSPGGLYDSSTTAAPTSVTTSSSNRAETRLKATSALQNDASVDQVMVAGVLPLGLAGPQTIQAAVTNRGALTLSNLQVTLNITGAETFNDTQTIPALAPCNQQLVTFAVFTPTAIGSDTVQVTVAADDFAGNDSKSRPLSVTVPESSYKYPGATSVLGLGGAGSPLAIVGKFTTAAATSVTAVNLDFFVPTATTYKVAIYGDDGSGQPGTELYLDSTDRIVAAAGPATIALAPAVPVGPGNFFVGFQQTNSIYAYVGYDPESPVRGGAFFYANVPPSLWVDFANSSNNFKPNIGVVLDRCAATPIVSNNGPICEGATLQLQASVAGGATYSWTGPNGFTSNEQNPSIPGAMPAASGIYTVVVNGCASPPTTAATVIASGGACDDGNACTVGNTCGGGICGTAATAPAETGDVAAAADKATYTWSVDPLATGYQAVRGSTAALPVGPGGGDEVCFDNLAGPVLVDATAPAPGGAFWYLSRAENACGAGTYGTQSNGSPRITTTCP